MSILAALAYVNLAIWCYLLWMRGGFWRVSALDEMPAPAACKWPSITAIIPARNEADMIESTLPALLASDYSGEFQIVLVDDNSDDDTAGAAARIATQCHASHRLSVVRARPLPQGWKGKVWAMQCGLEHIASQPQPPRYILFTDADIAYDKDALALLVKRAETGGLILASLMVRLRCASYAERLLVPAFVYFFRMIYPFAWVSNSERKMAAAAGGCMLARYDTLQQVGDMTQIRAALIDDCAFARLMKPHGPIWLGLTQRARSMRPYPRFEDIRCMVARSAYHQLGYSPLMLAAAVSGLFITFILPPLLSVFASGTVQLCGMLCWGAMAVSFIPMLRFYDRSWLQGFLLPLIAVLYLGFTLDSAFQHWQGRGGMWKGRIQATGAQNA